MGPRARTKTKMHPFGVKPADAGVRQEQDKDLLASMAGTSMAGPGRMPSRAAGSSAAACWCWCWGATGISIAATAAAKSAAMPRRCAWRWWNSATCRWWSAAWAPWSPTPWSSSAPGCRAPWNAPISRKATSSRRATFCSRSIRAPSRRRWRRPKPSMPATRRRCRTRCATATAMSRLRQQGAISLQQSDTSQTNADVMSATSRPTRRRWTWRGSIWTTPRSARRWTARPGRSWCSPAT